MVRSQLAGSNRNSTSASTRNEGWIGEPLSHAGPYARRSRGSHTVALSAVSAQAPFEPDPSSGAHARFGPYPRNFSTTRAISASSRISGLPIVRAIAYWRASTSTSCASQSARSSVGPVAITP